MNQNIYFNIFLLLVILLIIKYISPDPDSVLYVLKKYLNFLIFKINNFLKNLFNCNENFIETSFIGRTFNGIQNFNDKAPNFITYHQNIFIQKMIEKNPKLEIKTLKKLYNFIEKLVSTDTDDYFMTVSDSDPKMFNENELDKIKNIIMNKLNSGEFIFTNIDIKDPIVYYNNFSGKEINPFPFMVDCKDIGKLKIFIEIDIRNDVVRNSSYLVIKKIRINMDVNLQNNKIVNFNIEDDITNKVIYNDIKLDEIPTICNTKYQPKSFDDPMNINMKYSSHEIPNNFNIDFNDIEIPNYDDIINGYDNFNEHQNIKINNNSSNYTESKTPKYIDSSKTPKYIDSSKIPKYIDSSKIPKYIDSSKTPKYIDSSKTPKYTDSSKTPKYTDSSKTPKYTDSSKTPKYTDSSKTPKYTDSSSNYNRSSNNYNGSSNNYNGSSNNYNRSSNNYNGSSNNYNGSSNNYNGSSNNYDESSDNYNESSDNYNESSDNYNESSDNYNESSDNYNESSNNSKEFLRSNDVLYNSKNNSNEIFSIQMPLLDFSREYIPIKSNKSRSIEAVNSNESSNNMLDNLSSFKIPHEPKRSTDISENNEFSLAQQYSSSYNY